MVSDGRGFFRLVLTYSLVMLVAFLAVGVFYREFSKAFLGAAPGVEATYYLSLAHGHTLVAGALIPLALAATAYIAEGALGASPDYRGLRKAFITYAAGSVAAVALLIYKGAGIVYYYQLTGSVEVAEQALFLGSHALREALYGTAHLVMGAGLVWAVAKLLAAIRRAG